jgi:hypothetical protein
MVAQRSAQRLRRFCKNCNGQVVNLAGMMQHVRAVRIIEKLDE